MKKWIKRLVAPALVVAASMGLSACSIFESEDKSSYIFSNYDNTYYVNEDFVIDGTKLKITDKNGAETEITVTADMIKSLPDMSTAGVKKIVIVYKGVEYSFTIKVEARPMNELTAKLQEFLAKYESGEASSIYANILTDIDAKYFNQKGELNKYLSLDVTSQDFSEDALANTLYNAIIDAIVEGSFNIDANNIINAEDMKAKLDTIKSIEKFETEVSDFDIVNYVIDSILPESDEYYINKVNEFICNSMMISTRSGQLAMKNVISDYYFKLKGLNQFELRDLYIDVLTVVNTHTDEILIKEATSNLITLDVNDLKNLVSDLVYTQTLNGYKVLTVENWVDHCYSLDVEPVFETSAVATNLIKQQANARKSITKAQETMIEQLVTFDGTTSVRQIILDYVQAHIDYSANMYAITSLCESKQWLLGSSADPDYWPEIYVHVTYQYDSTLGKYVYKAYPEYEGEKDEWQTYNDYATEIYNVINSDDIKGLIRDYQLVEILVQELLVDEQIIAEDSKQDVVDKIYSIIESESTGKDLYNEILSMVLTEEDSYYISTAVDFVSAYTMIDSLSGQLELEEVISTYYHKLKNAESFDVKQAFVDILTVVNTYTTDEMIKTATASLKTMELEEIAHVISNVQKVYYVNNLELLPAEYVGMSWKADEIEQYFVTDAESLAIIEQYANNEQSLIKNAENVMLDLMSVTSVEGFKNCVVNYISNIEAYYNEYIAIMEILKQKDLMLCEVDEDGYIACLVDYYYDYNSNGYEVVLNHDYDINCAQENADIYAMSCSYIELVWDLATDFESATKDLADMYKAEIVDYVMMLVEGAGFESDTEVYAEIQTLVGNVIDDYVAGTLDIDAITSEIDRLINAYAHEDTKTILKAGHMLVMSLMYDEEVDYNEIFKDIELPYQIESVDYNVLMKKLFDESTYNAFTFSDVEVEYLTNDAGEIIGESLTLTIDVNFDAIISSLTGDIKINLVLGFEG